MRSKSTSALRSEACNALGASDGVIDSSISLEAACLRAAANNKRGVKATLRDQRSTCSRQLRLAISRHAPVKKHCLATTPEPPLGNANPKGRSEAQT